MGTLLRRDMLLGKFARNKSASLDEPPPSSAMPRSPNDSPPIEKKKLKRVVANNNGGAISRSNTFPGAASPPKSILKHRVSRYSAGDERRVQFNVDTFVQFIHDNGEKTTSTEQLCVVPKDRKEFMMRNLMRISNNHENTDNLSTQIFTYQNTNSEGTHEVHVSFLTDKESGNMRLKMLVKVGCNFSPDEICVKANMSGNKIRVLATKVLQDESGSQKSEPFNERFLLPVEVDPYSVEARLDNRGNLTIEAPLMSHTKRTDIAKEQADSQNKSL